MTYKAMQPFLKGFYFTLYGWRLDRDPEGWRLVKKHAGGKTDFEMETPSNAPERVVPVPRLVDDLNCLLEWTDSDILFLIRVRPHVSASVMLGFRDAAKVGYGITSVDPQDLGVVVYEHGVWTDKIKATSSNHNVLLNFVNFLVQGVNDGTIAKGTEVFLFTDNYVRKRAYFRGTASTPSLFELVLTLLKLEMRGNIHLHLTWVAGTRLIEQGADGLSRGDLENGVMTGQTMLDFIPIHQGTFDRSPGLREWIGSYLSDNVTFLDTRDWFDRAHAGFSLMVLSPPHQLLRLVLRNFSSQGTHARLQDI